MSNYSGTDSSYRVRFCSTKGDSLLHFLNGKIYNPFPQDMESHLAVRDIAEHHIEGSCFVRQGLVCACPGGCGSRSKGLGSRVFFVCESQVRAGWRNMVWFCNREGLPGVGGILILTC